MRSKKAQAIAVNERPHRTAIASSERTNCATEGQ
jgi:hypothetical protein